MKPQSHLKAFFRILDARNKEFYRDFGTLVWSLAFPILVIVGFSFIFSGDSQKVFKIAYQSTRPVESIPYLKIPHVDLVRVEEVTGPNGAIEKLKRHQFDLVVSESIGQTTVHYWINSTAPKGELVERILLGSAPDPSILKRQAVEGREIRYVDWLIAGLLGMNMMFSALFGVGYTIVRYRKNGVLKRFKATPLAAGVFLLAQVSSRLLLIMVVTALVFFGTNALVHFQMIGSYFDLGVVYTVGAMCLISLGLLLAARIRSEEFAGGALNVLSWPMMFLSGVWFSLEGSPAWVQKAALIFPLSHIIDAARSIMTEGAGWDQFGWHVVVLAVMTVVFLTIGTLTFKWE